MKDGFAYANGVFSHLKEGDIYIDEYSTKYRNNYENNRHGNSILHYFLNEPSMAWAWYVGLGMVLMYVIFQSKRKQRIIPFIEKKKNISLEHAKSIGRLYFLREHHTNLANQKIKLFTYFMKNKYGIAIDDLNENIQNKIAIKTKKSTKEIKELVSVIKYTANAKYIDERDLHRIERAFRPFYN